MPSPELDGLIIDHLFDIDASVKRLVELQREIFQVMMDKTRDWAEKEDWLGSYDYIEGGCWVAPHNWRMPDAEPDREPDREDFKAFFEMELGAGDTEEGKPDEDHFYLTRLCGAGSGQIGFRFMQRMMRKVAWKNRLRDQAPTISRTAFLTDIVPSFFLPFRVDATELAAAARQEEIEDALTPFVRALQQLVDSKLAFDKVLATMKTEKSTS